MEISRRAEEEHLPGTKTRTTSLTLPPSLCCKHRQPFLRAGEVRAMPPEASHLPPSQTARMKSISRLVQPGTIYDFPGSEHSAPLCTVALCFVGELIILCLCVALGPFSNARAFNSLPSEHVTQRRPLTSPLAVHTCESPPWCPVHM